MTVKQAANRLGLSEGHIKKLKARYRKFGPSSMLHGNCGRQSKHALDIQFKQEILEIYLNMILLMLFCSISITTPHGIIL